MMRRQFFFKKRKKKNGCKKKKVPPERIELPTPGLQDQCSATELQRLRCTLKIQQAIYTNTQDLPAFQLLQSFRSFSSFWRMVERPAPASNSQVFFS